MINLPIIYRFFWLIYRLSSTGRTGNLPIFNRPNSINYRSGWFIPVLRFWKPDPNHHLTIYRRGVKASANPSIIHRRFGVIHRPACCGNAAWTRDQRADAVSTSSARSTDKASARLWNPSTDILSNLAIIGWRNHQIDGQLAGKNIRNYQQLIQPVSVAAVVALGQWRVELSDNRQAILNNRQTLSPMRRLGALLSTRLPCSRSLWFIIGQGKKGACSSVRKKSCRRREHSDLKSEALRKRRLNLTMDVSLAKKHYIITPDWFTSRARGRSFGDGPCFFGARR